MCAYVIAISSQKMDISNKDISYVCMCVDDSTD